MSSEIGVLDGPGVGEWILAIIDSGCSCTLLKAKYIKRLQKAGVKVVPSSDVKVQTAEESAEVMVSLGKTEALEMPAQSLGHAENLELPRAAFVAGLSCSLLSVSDLMMAGWDVHFVSKHMVCVLKKGDREISVQMVEGLFPVMLNIDGSLKCDENTMQQFNHIMKLTEHAHVASRPGSAGPSKAADLRHPEHALSEAAGEETGTVSSSSKLNSNLGASQTPHAPAHNADFRLSKTPTKTPLTVDDFEIAPGDSTQRVLLAVDNHAGKSFKDVLHERLNHKVVRKGDPLDKMLTAVYGKKYTDSKLSPCDACMRNKTHQVQHPRRTREEKMARRGDGPFGDVYCDCYAMPYPGREGEYYFYLLYNAGRNIAVFPTPTKDNASQWVVNTMTTWQLNGGKYHTLTEAYYHIDMHPADDAESGEAPTFDPGAAIRCYRPDGATELISAMVRGELQRKGIRIRASGVAVPQQNETENMGKVVLQALGALMWTSGLPYHYWPDAVRHVADTHFILPNKAVPDKWRTPCEAYHQREVDFGKLLRHHYTFGQLVMVHVLRSQRHHTHELPTAHRAYYLGYSQHQVGHTVLFEHNNKVATGVVNIFGGHRCPLAEARAARLMHRHTEERH
ncbi:MAG: hypothetical protein GY811_28925, partial [Myxococcales bacterium]|nr:hypothetical protein [Myxococcales bacterium]